MLPLARRSVNCSCGNDAAVSSEVCSPGVLNRYPWTSLEKANREG
jgi:hypothetical protein